MGIDKEKSNKLDDWSIEIIQPKEDRERKKNRVSGTYRIISKWLKY